MKEENISELKESCEILKEESRKQMKKFLKSFDEKEHVDIFMKFSKSIVKWRLRDGNIYCVLIGEKEKMISENNPIVNDFFSEFSDVKAIEFSKSFAKYSIYKY